jgi:hypothetical protein
MATDAGTLATSGLELLRVITVPLPPAGAVSPTVQFERRGGSIISGLHENTFKLGNTETLPPDAESFWMLPEASKADAPEITMSDLAFEWSAERISLTVATMPSAIPVVSPPQAVHVFNPAAPLHEIDLPETEAADPGATEIEEISALE